MFSYYGSKSKLAKKYPPPVFNVIVEPFAGAAWYSMAYPAKKIILNEKNKTIYRIWKWLITEATQEEVLSCTEFYVGQDISTLNIRKEHKDLIGFCINRGSVSPANIVQQWSCQVRSRPTWASTVSFALHRVALFLPRIRHWEVYNTDYSTLHNINATWFVDPPYQFGGEHYIHNQIDYPVLSEWIKKRNGQIIVCENDKADWMEFEKLVRLTGQRKKTVESLWSNVSLDRRLSLNITGFMDESPAGHRMKADGISQYIDQTAHDYAKRETEHHNGRRNKNFRKVYDAVRYGIKLGLELQKRKK